MWTEKKLEEKSSRGKKFDFFGDSNFFPLELFSYSPPVELGLGFGLSLNLLLILLSITSTLHLCHPLSYGEGRSTFRSFVFMCVCIFSTLCYWSIPFVDFNEALDICNTSWGWAINLLICPVHWGQGNDLHGGKPGQCVPVHGLFGQCEVHFLMCTRWHKT